jgi:hypothetical protein
MIQVTYAYPIVMREPSFVKRDAIEEAFEIHGIEFRRGLSGAGTRLGSHTWLNMDYSIDRKISLWQITSIFSRGTLETIQV